jgi:hypothetical protein
MNLVVGREYVVSAYFITGKGTNCHDAFPSDIERTYDRSIQRFISIKQKDLRDRKDVCEGFNNYKRFFML